jgi:nicotinamide-nucleotide amidase
VTSPRTACTISVGDELLAGESLDTHGRTIAAALGARGCRVVSHRVVGDDVAAIAAAIREAVGISDLVIVTGGLGPTLDDVTREALAEVLEDPLVDDVEALATLEAWFAGRGRSMPETNRRQIMRPGSARLLPNPHGTAPGIAADRGGVPIAILPGPPREMAPMLELVIDVHLADSPPRPVVVVRAIGIGESDAATRISELMRRDAMIPVATTVSDSIVSARIRGRDAGDREEVERLACEVESAWTPFAFDRGDGSLEAAVGTLLLDRRATIATAESCTGGLLAGALTAVPGSSAWFPGGVVTYANERKVEDLGVSESDLVRDGAVSRAVAIAMASGARRRADATIGVATTGIAGPDGGSDEKPVGTVWIAVADEQGEDARCFRFPGTRDIVRRRTVLAALQLVRLRLLGEATPLLWERAPQA